MTRWQDFTSPQLARYIDDRTVVVGALGAVEQHGPHLPLDTDTVIAEALLEAALSRLPERLKVVTLPTLAIGASDEHKSFAGTLGFDAVTVAGMLESLGSDVARAGGRRLVWVNGHGGNRAAMDIAALALRRRFGMLAVKCSYTRLGDPPGGDIDELARGFHGGWLETALMLHLAPQQVRIDHLGDFAAAKIAPAKPGANHRALLGPEGAASFGWLTEDLNAAGVIGNAAAATAGQGARLVEFYAERIAGVLAETAKLDIGGFKSG